MSTTQDVWAEYAGGGKEFMVPLEYKLWQLEEGHVRGWYSGYDLAILLTDLMRKRDERRIQSR